MSGGATAVAAVAASPLAAPLASAAVQEAGLNRATSKMIGFLLAICGNTLIACSLTMQKSAHNQVAVQRTQAATDAEAGGLAPEKDGSDIGAEPDFVRNPTWLLGTALMGLGEIGNFAAFAFAPASLVAPLGAWSVVLSAVLAHVFLREEISARNLLGIILCVGGAFMIGMTGPDVSKAERNLDANTIVTLLLDPRFVVFMVLVLTSTVVLMYASHRTSLGKRFVFVTVGVSSLLGAVTVVCAKALSTFVKVTLFGTSQFGNWLPYALVIVLAGAILLQLRYLNMAMARFGNAEVIPVYYVLFTMCAMTSGVIMYREFEALSAGNIPFFVGVIATMSGVFLICRGAVPVGDKNSPAPGAEGTVPRKRGGGYERVHAPTKVHTEPLDW